MAKKKPVKKAAKAQAQPPKPTKAQLAAFKARVKVKEELPWVTESCKYPWPLPTPEQIDKAWLKVIGWQKDSEITDSFAVGFRAGVMRALAWVQRGTPNILEKLDFEDYRDANQEEEGE